MKYIQLIGLTLPVIFSFSTQAGPAEDFKQGADAYYAQQDVVTAMQYLEPAAVNGHVEAQVLLAYILDKSGEDAQAVSWYEKAASTGDADGEYGLGLMLSVGEGVDIDEEKAVDLINSAAAKGHAQAMVWLVDAYAKGRFGIEKDAVKSNEWADKAEQALELKK